jgi:hypothetical protein
MLRRMNRLSTNFILNKINQTTCKTSALQRASETCTIPLQMQRTIADYEGVVLDHPGGTQADIESAIEAEKEDLAAEYYSSRLTK